MSGPHGPRLQPRAAVEDAAVRRKAVLERRPKFTEQTSPTQVKSGVGTEEKGLVSSLNNLFARCNDKILDGVVKRL